MKSKLGEAEQSKSKVAGRRILDPVSCRRWRTGRGRQWRRKAAKTGDVAVWRRKKDVAVWRRKKSAAAGRN